MGTKAFLSANEAAAHGVRLARPQVIAAYPITPQTTLVEKLADFIADGQSDARYMMVESEHSAMAAALGASMMGARTFTASSSQGLLSEYTGQPFTFLFLISSSMTDSMPAAVCSLADR